jgi:hypothetical protein
MENQSLHLKLQFSQALYAKKSVLATELNFLQVIKRIENYLVLRKKELIIKTELREKIKELTSELNELLHELPKIKEDMNMAEEFKETFKSNVKEKKNNKVLEMELREIKRKLKDLEELK